MADDTSDLTTVVGTGNRVEALTALRDHLALRLVHSVDDRVVAPIAKQLADVMAELEKLNPPKQESAVDDLAAARAARRQDAAVSKRAAGGKQRGGRGRPADGVGEPTA